MKIGLIGLGNIGGMLTRRLVEFVDPSQIFVFTKTSSKARSFHRELGVNVSSSIRDLNKQCDIIILCMRPQELDKVLKEIKITKNKIFITTVAAITQDKYYDVLGRVELIRFIPSMINKIGGPLLLMRGKYASVHSTQKVRRILSKIGTVYSVTEDKIDAYTHLTSCSAAVIAEFVRLYVESLHDLKDGPDQKQANKLVIEVLGVVAPLMKESGFDIIPQACTKGGITEKAISAMGKHKKTFFKDVSSSLLTRMKEINKEYGK